MKKTSRILGAVGLSCALALGTAVPAFADPGDETTPNPTVVEGDNSFTAVEALPDGTQDVDDDAFNPDTTSKGSTAVRVLSRVGQIDATVPLMVYVVANTVGGDLLGSPTGTGAATAVSAGTIPDGTSATNNVAWKYTGYRIENNSNVDIAVKSIEVQGENATGDPAPDKVVSGKWTYVADTVTIDKDAMENYIYLEVTPFKTTSKGAETSTDGAAAGASAKGTTKRLSTTAFDTSDALSEWLVPKAEIYAGAEVVTGEKKTPGVLGIKLSGATSKVAGAKDIFVTDFTDANGYGTDASASAGLGDVNLIYTIEAANTNTANTVTP